VSGHLNPGGQQFRDDDGTADPHVTEALAAYHAGQGSEQDALTALAAQPDGAGWRWQTWHLYPATPGGTVVYTTSRWRP